MLWARPVKGSSRGGTSVFKDDIRIPTDQRNWLGTITGTDSDLSCDRTQNKSQEKRFSKMWLHCVDIGVSSVKHNIQKWILWSIVLTTSRDREDAPK